MSIAEAWASVCGPVEGCVIEGDLRRQRCFAATVIPSCTKTQEDTLKELTLYNLRRGSRADASSGDAPLQITLLGSQVLFAAERFV